MWRHVAEAGEVDLVGRKQGSDNPFNRKDDVHQRMTFSWIEIAHLTNVSSPNNAAKSWVVNIGNTDDTVILGLPEEYPSGAPAKLAGLCMVIQCPLPLIIDQLGVVESVSPKIKAKVASISRKTQV